MSTPIDPELLCRIGLALHGPGWERWLAAQLPMAPRKLRRMAAGEVPAPGDLRPKLIMLIDMHGSHLKSLIKELRNDQNLRDV